MSIYFFPKKVYNIYTAKGKGLNKMPEEKEIIECVKYAMKILGDRANSSTRSFDTTWAYHNALSLLEEAMNCNWEVMHEWDYEGE